MPTNLELLNDGDIIDHWTCDVNFETGEMESNGSVQALVGYEGREYLIIVNYQFSEVREPGKEATEYHPIED